MATTTPANAHPSASGAIQVIEGALPAVAKLFDNTSQSACEFGDITLVIEDGYHPQLRLTVNSCILASTSKVFRTLFQGCFAEGAAIRSGVREIYMNDKPAPVLALCQLLHLKPVEPAVTQWTLLDFALLVDKFECVQALKLATDGIIWQFPTSQSYDLIVGAYILDQPGHFRRFTQALVLQSPIVYPYDLESQPAIPVLEHLPANFRMSISHQQISVSNEIVHCLTTIVDDFTTFSCAQGAAMLVSQLMTVLRNSRLWPIGPAISGTRRITDQLNSLHSLELPIILPMPHDSNKNAWPSITSSVVVAVPRRRHVELGAWIDAGEESWSSSSPRSYLRVSPPTVRTLTGLAENLSKLCVGLCLDCLKGNDMCRLAHPDPWPAYHFATRELLSENTYFERDESEYVEWAAARSVASERVEEDGAWGLHV